MFPHTITIFQKTDNSYKKTVINGVIWYGSDGLVLSGKGIQDSINKDDSIVKGEANDIEKSITELNKYKDVITVMSVNNYDFGSGLDCILIGGN